MIPFKPAKGGASRGEEGETDAKLPLEVGEGRKEGMKVKGKRDKWDKN